MSDTKPLSELSRDIEDDRPVDDILNDTRGDDIEDDADALPSDIEDSLGDVQGAFAELSAMQEEFRSLNEMMPENLTRVQRRLLKKKFKKEMKKTGKSFQELMLEEKKQELIEAANKRKTFFDWDGKLNISTSKKTEEE